MRTVFKLVGVLIVMSFILVSCTTSDSIIEDQIEAQDDIIDTSYMVSEDSINEVMINESIDCNIEYNETLTCNLIRDAKEDGAEDDVIACLEIYEKQLKQKMQPITATQLDRWSMLRYSLFDINKDAIPELMLCFGDSHIEHIYVWSIFNDNMYFYGAYGSWGSVYIDDNIIVSIYGGQGYYYTVFSKECEMVKIGLDNGRGYYYSVAFTGNWNGSMGQLIDNQFIEKDAITELDAFYRVSISEDEYYKQFDITDEFVKFDYSNMRALYSEAED